MSNYELRLFKLCCTRESEYEMNYVDELGWINDKQFCVLVPYLFVREFTEGLKKIFGYGLFDDGGFDCNMQFDGICIVLNDALSGYGIDFEEVFPKEKYRH